MEYKFIEVTNSNGDKKYYIKKKFLGFIWLYLSDINFYDIESNKFYPNVYFYSLEDAKVYISKYERKNMKHKQISNKKVVEYYKSE